MTENRTRASIIGDRWLIVIALTLIAITAWNSRYALIPAPTGYARYTKYEISFLYPDYLDPWEAPINDDGSEVRDGSRTVSEDWGEVGWYSGNVDFERPGREGYFDQSGVLWVADRQPDNLEEVLNLFYTKAKSVAKRRGREIEVSAGSVGRLTVRGHEVIYQFFNYTQIVAGEYLQTIIWGVVGGWYCEDSGRMIALYYEEWYTVDPVYDGPELFNKFKFYLESVRCH
jgi:hypothetical protein